jgi:hypothetical protein
MDSIPEFGVMTRLIEGQCVQSLLRRGNAKSSLDIKHLKLILVPGREQLFWTESSQIGRSGRKICRR